MKHKIQAAIVFFFLCLITAWSVKESRQIAHYENPGQQTMQVRGGQEQTERYVRYPKVNYVTNPVGIDSQDITFSWEIYGYEQQAYRITVTDEAEQCVWDSGIVQGDDTIQVAYAGEPLSDLMRYRYTIQSFDGENCYMSPQASFETAYVQGKPFVNADFIAMQGEENVYGDGQPIFCKTFQAEEKTLEKAYFLGSALGIYDVWINGRRVGEDELKPGWTDYNDTLLYQMYDVTDALLTNEQNAEENHIAIMLGTGWWCGRNAFGTYGFHQPALIGELVLTFSDGSTQRISTDSTWQYVKDTRVQFADFFNGETVDYRKPDTKALSQGKTEELIFRDVVISQDFGGSFHSFYGYQNKRRPQLTRFMTAGYLYEKTQDNGSTYGEVIKLAKWQEEPQDGILIPAGQTLIVDLGQNIAGVPEFAFSSETENEITVQFAEMLNDSGREEKGNDGPAGSLYRKNYRSATTTVTVVTDETEHTVYSPSFFFTGFRYLSVTAKNDIIISQIKGICIGNDSPETGSFTCDNDKLSRLYENVRWSQRNNYTLIATDCPQRDERLGWMGDLQSFCATSLYNQDLFSFYEKWSRDLRDAQTAEGAFTDTVPATVTTGSGNGGWAEAGIMVPLQVYDKYGDKRMLESVYPSMKRYMAYLASVSSFVPEDGHMGPGNLLGDWLGAQDTDSTFLSVLWYAADASYMSKVAEILGEKADQKAYEELFASLRDYIDKVYLQGDFAEEMTQTELCFLLRYQLLTDAQRQQAARALADSVKENDYRLVTGFAGTPILLHTLTEQGESNFAYRVLLCEENPSWLYSVNQGATTIWERYDSYTAEDGFADFAMNSFDHFNEGSVAQWIYEDLLGIRVALSEEEPVRIAPELPDADVDLHKAQGSYHSVFGEIAVSWEISDKKCSTGGSEGDAQTDDIADDITDDITDREVIFRLRIPYGVKARVSLPVKDCENMLLSGGNWEFEGELLQQ